MKNHVPQTDVSRVPKPPAQCGVYGCPHEAQILFMTVNDYGRARCGAALDFCFENERTHELTMRGDYEFVRWIPRCAEHYQQDLDGTRKSRSDYLKSLPEASS